MGDDAVGQDLSDEQIDSLVERSETASNRDIPMTAPDKSASDTDKSPDPFEFKDAKGNPFKITRDEILKMRDQVSGLPQRLNKFNQDRQKWENDRTQWEQKWVPYKQIDEWASQNPDKWRSLEQAWKTGQSQPNQIQANDPYAPKFQNLEQKLAQIEQFTQSQIAKEQTQQREELDKRLEQDIKSIRDEYKDLDWNILDDQGKSLETKVLEHAAQNGIQNFKTAFRDFYHDQLIERASAQAKLNVSKGLQSQSKLGVLGKSPTSVKRGLTEAKDPRKQSYEELAREAMEELRAGA